MALRTGLTGGHNLAFMITFVQGAFVDLKSRLRNELFLKITKWLGFDGWNLLFTFFSRVCVCVGGAGFWKTFWHLEPRPFRAVL